MADAGEEEGGKEELRLNFRIIPQDEATLQPTNEVFFRK